MGDHRKTLSRKEKKQDHDRTQLLREFAQALLPKASAKWELQELLLRNADPIAAKEIDAIRPPLRGMAFLQAFQAEVLRRLLEKAESELLRFQREEDIKILARYVKQLPPSGIPNIEKGPKASSLWFRPMTIQQFMEATTLGSTQIKNWLNEIPDRDSHTEPAPKMRGKGRLKAYRWPVVRVIIRRWLLSPRITSKERKKWLEGMANFAWIAPSLYADLMMFVTNDPGLRKGFGSWVPHYETGAAALNRLRKSIATDPSSPDSPALPSPFQLDASVLKYLSDTM